MDYCYAFFSKRRNSTLIFAKIVHLAHHHLWSTFSSKILCFREHLFKFGFRANLPANFKIHHQQKHRTFKGISHKSVIHSNGFILPWQVSVIQVINVTIVWIPLSRCVSRYQDLEEFANNIKLNDVGFVWGCLMSIWPWTSKHLLRRYLDPLK